MVLRAMPSCIHAMPDLLPENMHTVHSSVPSPEGIPSRAIGTMGPVIGPSAPSAPTGMRTAETLPSAPATVTSAAPSSTATCTSKSSISSFRVHLSL